MANWRSQRLHSKAKLFGIHQGKDIFTEDFSVYEKHIEATDFNGEKYHIKIKDGDNTLIKV